MRTGDYTTEKTIIYDELGVPYVKTDIRNFDKYNAGRPSSELTMIEGFFPKNDSDKLIYMKYCENLASNRCDSYHVLISRKSKENFEIADENNNYDITKSYKLHEFYLDKYKTTLINLGFDAEGVKQ